MRRFTIIVLGFILFSLGLAQFGISPLYRTIELEQGRAQTTFNVHNGTAESMRYRVSVHPFILDGGLELIASDDHRVNADLSPYVRIAPQEFILPAGRVQRVRLISTIPPSAMAGELRAALMVEPLLEASQRQTHETEGGLIELVVELQYCFIAPVIVRSPEAQAQLQLLDLSYHPVSEVQDQLHISLQNNGYVSAIGGITWRLTRDGVEVAFTDVYKLTMIFPDSVRTLNFDLDQLEPGEYTLTAEVRDLSIVTLFDEAPIIYTFSDTLFVP